MNDESEADGSPETSRPDPSDRHRAILDAIHIAMRHSGNRDCMTCALIAPALDRYLREQGGDA